MDSVLRPRDIQARIRSGESPETVAAAAQTSIERVMTFASPVLAERAFVAQQALKASVRRRTGDGAPGQLGAAVAERLSTQHLDAEDVEWDAWRREDGRWTLVAEYDAPTGPERAEFVYDTAGRYVTATDEQSRWLVGERVTADPGGAGAGTQMHLGDDAIELVTGRRPAPPVDLDTSEQEAASQPTGPGQRVTSLRPVPHPVDALVDRSETAPAERSDEHAPTPDPTPAPGHAPGPGPAPAAPAARASEPDEITVDLTESADAARAARPGGAARPARPARPMADADWMATQASERPARAADPSPSPEPTPEPEPTPGPAPETEALFEVPPPEPAPETGPDGTEGAETSGEAAPAAPSTGPAESTKSAKSAKSAKGRSGKSSKGRAAIPSWDEIMFGSSND